MKKTLLPVHLLVGLLLTLGSCDQHTATDEKLSVQERMAKARTAKADKKNNPVANDAGIIKPEKATEADYKAPVDKVLKGPNGEEVRTGERGAKFYINKNGNKTYLSSNQ